MRTGCIHYSASMIKKLESKNPDVYVAGNQHGLYPDSVNIFPTYIGLITAILNSILAIPILFLFLLFKKLKHRNLSLYFPAFHSWNFLLCLYSRVMGINTIQTIHDYRSHTGERNPIVDFLKLRTISLASQIIFLSEHERQLAIATNPSIKKKSHTLLHPLLYWPDLKLSELDFQIKPRLLLFGRINAYKGLDLFTKAVDPIQDKFEKIVVAGKFQSGLEKYKRPFIEYIDRYLSEEEIAELLGEFHILVLPYSEATQSGVLPLGVQAGIPMVISKVGGIPEQIDQSSAVFVYPNHLDIREGIEFLLNESNYNSIKKRLIEYKVEFERTWSQNFNSIKEKLFI